MKYVALLRGINVGGKNTLSMAELKNALGQAGFQNVQTYINSGNVLFESAEADELKLARQVEKTIEKAFGLEVKTLVLNEQQLRKVLDQAPKGFGTEPDKYHTDVIFLMGTTSSEAIKIFSPREGVDKVWQGDLAIYSQRLSAERTKSRLSKIMASPLYKSMTIRTLKTVQRLLSITDNK